MDNNLDQLDNLKKFIKVILDILDKSKSKYKDYINNKNVYLDYSLKLITFKKNEEIIYSKNFSILGIFDQSTKVWLWSWVMSSLSINDTKEARQILNYGLMLDPLNNTHIHYYIKSHLVNSRIFFENDILFDIHLGLSIYISKAQFIFYIQANNIIYYYLVF